MPSHGPGLASRLLAGAFAWTRGKRQAGVPPPEVAAEAPVALFLTRDALVRWANAAAERLTGRTQEQLLGSDLFELFGLEAPDAAPGAAQETRRMVLWTDGAGNRRWLDVATSRCSSGGEPGFVAVALDVTQQKEEEERILFRATHDELTGLPNRLLLLERLAGAMASAKRRARAMAVLSLDLHRFRAINDTMGYAVGDRLLQEMASRLRSSVRESDVVARVDADRFAVLLTEMSDAGDVGQVARKILALVAEPIRLEGTEVSLSASIGIALHPAESGDAEDLLRRADVALSRAKDKGPGSIELSTREETTSRALERLAIENGLRYAIQRDQFVLFYQPVIGLRSGRTEGVEALLRWQRTEGPLTKPEQFIGLAEESRLIVPIGGWVLRTACAQARAWHEKGWSWLNVAVNVSAAQFQEPDLVASIERTLAEAGLPPERLELEITESVAMKNIDMTIAVLRQLRDMGIGVAIDDFGTGHSSLSYLRKFPITKVKIDGSFVREVLTDRNDAAIVTAIVSMAREMGLTTVAEGVETPGQLAFLTRLGCDEVQGFVLAHPSPEEDVTAWFDGKHVAGALAGLAAQAGVESGVSSGA